MNVKNALVVDDSKTARLTLKRQLEKRSITVDVAESGEDAIKHLDSKKPDVIFMDIMMPGMDGLEATRIITGTPALAHIPVVMCTSKDDDKSRNEAKVSGAKGFAVKPISADQLDAAIAKANQIMSHDGDHATPAKVEQPATVQPIESPSMDQSGQNKSAEKISRAVAEKVAKQVAEQVAKQTAAKIAEEIAIETAGKIAFEIAEPQARTIAERIANEVAEQQTESIVKNIASKIAENIARTKINEIMATTGPAIIEKAVHEQLNSALNNFQQKLQTTSREYVASSKLTNELDKIIQKRATSAAAVVAKKFATEIEETAQKIAENAVSKSAGSAKIMAIISLLGVIAIGALVASQHFM